MIRAEWNTLSEAMRDMKELSGVPVERALRPATLEDAVRAADSVLDREEKPTIARLMEEADGLRTALSRRQEELLAWRNLGLEIENTNIPRPAILARVRELLTGESHG